MVSDDEKSFQIDLQFSELLRNKALKLLELRYQVAILIIPTIIGLWGFLGLIVTSKIMKDNFFTVYLLIYIGLIVTIFLIFVWRKWVHDMFDEELKLQISDLHIELRHSNSSNIVRVGIEAIFIEKIKKIDSKFYEYLRTCENEYGENIKNLPKEIPRDLPAKYKFYEQNRLKLSSSGFYLIDRGAQSIVAILWGIGIIVPLLLDSFVFKNSWIFFNICQNCIPVLIHVFIHVFIISAVAFFVLWQMQVLINETTFSEEDLHKSILYRNFETAKMKNE